MRKMGMRSARKYPDVRSASELTIAPAVYELAGAGRQDGQRSRDQAHALDG